MKKSYSAPARRAASRLGMAALAAAAFAGLIDSQHVLAYSPAGTAHLAALQKKAPSRATQAQTAPARAAPAVVTVARTAPGQTGYVHYFVITGPDGEPETQVGLELPGDRIAWSFPEQGVSIAPFIKTGQIVANGKAFEVEHLYGIRPFAEERAMAALRRELDSRVSWWLDQKTPYCDEQEPSNRVCLSCLGFVLRVLFPGASPGGVALPADFKSARRNVYTTEDLLMYLARVPLDGTRDSRAKRIEGLKVPESMREELARISDDVVPAHRGTEVAAKPALATPKPAGRRLAGTPRRTTRAGS